MTHVDCTCIAGGVGPGMPATLGGRLDSVRINGDAGWVYRGSTGDWFGFFSGGASLMSGHSKAYLSKYQASLSRTQSDRPRRRRQIANHQSTRDNQQAEVAKAVEKDCHQVTTPYQRSVCRVGSSPLTSAP